MGSQNEFESIIKERNLRYFRDYQDGVDSYYVGLKDWDNERISCCGFIFGFNGFNYTIDEKFTEMISMINKNKLIEEKP